MYYSINNVDCKYVLYSINNVDCKERNKFIVAGNREYKETESINPVQSSLKSHPLWVTLYYKLA